MEARRAHHPVALTAHEILQGNDIPFGQIIFFRAKAREHLFQTNKCSYLIVRHGNSKIHGRLKIEVVFILQNEDQIRSIAFCQVSFKGPNVVVKSHLKTREVGELANVEMPQEFGVCRNIVQHGRKAEDHINCAHYRPQQHIGREIGHLISPAQLIFPLDRLQVFMDMTCEALQPCGPGARVDSPADIVEPSIQGFRRFTHATDIA